MTRSSEEGPKTITTHESFSITNLYEFADQCHNFEFTVLSTEHSVCWENVLRNLQLTAEIAGGPTLPNISLHASSSFRVIQGAMGGVRVTISPAWWSHATSFTIVGLYYAGQLLNTPILPATVKVVHVNHTPSKAGGMFRSLRAGIAAGVISAIMDGCSTEESNTKVCIAYVLP